MMATQATEAARSLYAGLKAGGATFAVYLPDSVLAGVERLLEEDPDVNTVVCSREDEGIAIAVGAALAGEVPAALMEGSGVGYSGLILARAQSQRTPLLLVFSHTLALGDPFDYHAASRLAGEGVCRGLGIPCLVLDDRRSTQDTVAQALATVKGQKTIVAVAVPGHIRA